MEPRTDGDVMKNQIKKCSVKDCNDKYLCKSFCNKHYLRFMKHGDPLVLLSTSKKVIPSEVRFWKYVIKGKKPEDCWRWTGSKMVFGYGKFYGNKKYIPSHRYSYELHIGLIPDGLLVCHKCDNPECSNPLHLFLGTYQDNMDDKVSKGRESKLKGSLHPHAKLKEDDVVKIKNKLKEKVLMRILADQYKVSVGTIRAIKGGYIWKHVTIEE